MPAANRARPGLRDHLYANAFALSAVEQMSRVTDL